MTNDEKKALVRELLVSGDIEALRRHPGLIETIPMLQTLSAAFSEVEADIPLQFCAGDWVATRAVFQQTHSGAFMGVPATHKRIEHEVLFFHRVVDGRIVQQHSQADVVSMMRQIGVLPD
jgi:predicted ester cyclase